MMFYLSAYSENKYTVHRSVVSKNNSLGAVDIIFINPVLFEWRGQKCPTPRIFLNNSKTSY